MSMTMDRTIRATGRVGLALLFAATAPVGVAGQQDVRPMTMDEAVERALMHSPQMAQAEQQILNADEGQRMAVGSFLPTLSASAGSSLRSTDRFDPDTDRVVSGSSDSYSAGLNARYDLFTGGRRFAERNEARANMDAAEAQFTDQRFGVILQTKTQFLQALRQEELLAVAEARVQQAQESLELTRRQAELQVATVSDTLRARLEYMNAQQAALQASTGLRTARVQLGRLVGLDGPVDAEAPEGFRIEPLPLAPEEILSLAEEAAPSVRAAAASSGAAQAGVRAARTQYIPSIGLNSGYSWANQAASFGNGSTSWNLGLSISYPIFNGFQRESQVVRARAAHTVAVRQEADARLAARAEADAALQTLNMQARAVEIAEEAVAVAEEDLRVVRERYEVGVARIYDVVVSQVALDQARVDLVQARFDHQLALAELESVLGREL